MYVYITKFGFSVLPPNLSLSYLHKYYSVQWKGYSPDRSLHLFEYFFVISILVSLYKHCFLLIKCFRYPFSSMILHNLCLLTLLKDLSKLAKAKCVCLVDRHFLNSVRPLLTRQSYVIYLLYWHCLLYTSRCV